MRSDMLFEFLSGVAVLFAGFVGLALYSNLLDDHPQDQWAQCHAKGGTAIYTKECSSPCKLQFRECQIPPLPPIVQQDGKNSL